METKATLSPSSSGQHIQEVLLHLKDVSQKISSLEKTPFFSSTLAVFSPVENWDSRATQLIKNLEAKQNKNGLNQEEWKMLTTLFQELEKADISTLSRDLCAQNEKNPLLETITKLNQSLMDFFPLPRVPKEFAPKTGRENTSQSVAFLKNVSSDSISCLELSSEIPSDADLIAAFKQKIESLIDIYSSIKTDSVFSISEIPLASLLKLLFERGQSVVHSLERKSLIELSPQEKYLLVGLNTSLEEIEKNLAPAFSREEKLLSTLLLEIAAAEKFQYIKAMNKFHLLCKILNVPAEEKPIAFTSLLRMLDPSTISQALENQDTFWVVNKGLAFNFHKKTESIFHWRGFKSGWVDHFTITLSIGKEYQQIGKGSAESRNLETAVQKVINTISTRQGVPL